MKKKPKLYEDEPEAPCLNIGSFDSFTEVPKTDKRVKPQIGFIRPKKKTNAKNSKRRSTHK